MKEAHDCWLAVDLLVERLAHVGATARVFDDLLDDAAARVCRDAARARASDLARAAATATDTPAPHGL